MSAQADHQKAESKFSALFDELVEQAKERMFYSFPCNQ